MLKGLIHKEAHPAGIRYAVPDINNACRENKNSLGDEIANVNFYAVRPGSYPNSLK